MMRFTTPTRYRSSLAALALAALLASAPAARAQQPSPAPAPPGPAAKGSPAAPERTITLKPERPGTYSYWVVSEGNNQSGVATLTPSDTTARVTLPKSAVSVEVLDETTGLSAVKPVGEAKDGATVTVAPGDFTAAHTVIVKVTANGGKPVEKASVEIKDAKGATQSQVLAAADAGQAKFTNVALGKATVTATYGANNAEKATQDTSIAPAKGGGPVEVTLALSGNVPTVDAPAGTAADGTQNGGGGANAPTIVVQQPVAPAPAAPPRNDWVSGIVGIALLVTGAFFGLRYLRSRNMTVAEAVKGGLKSIGAELPDDLPAGPTGHLKPATTPAPLPPLASLNDLPAGGAAARGVPVPGVVPASNLPPPAPGVGPRLVGVAGPVSGEVFQLEPAAGLTVGRDAANALPLPQDNTLSRRHARFAAVPGGGWEVLDEGSSNGTYVNGRKAERQTLQPGDEVQVGGARFRYEV